MTTKVRLPLYLNWRALKETIGWPDSRANTWRRMFDDRYSHDPFPACRKIGNHPNSYPIWYTPDVLDYFKRHGLPVPENIEFC
jgi:hypothetical protein